MTLAIGFNDAQPKKHGRGLFDEDGIQFGRGRQLSLGTQQFGKNDRGSHSGCLHPKQGEEHGTGCGAKPIGIDLGDVIFGNHEASPNCN